MNRAIYSTKEFPIGKPAPAGENGRLSQQQQNAITYGWKAQDTTIEALIAHIVEGKPFTPAQFKKGHRHGNNFLRSNVFAPDIDGTIKEQGLNSKTVKYLSTPEYQALLSDPLIANHAAAVIQSYSSTEGRYKARVIFISDRVIDDRREYEAISRWITKQIIGADSTYDAGRFFYGGKSGRLPDFVVLDNRLNTSAILKQIVIEDQQREAARAEYLRTWQPPENSADLSEQVKEALSYIPKNGDYKEDWLSVLIAIHDAFPGSDGIALAENWSPGYPGEIEKKFASFKEHSGNKITIASLFWKARQNGYRPERNYPIGSHKVRLSVGIPAGDIELYHFKGGIPDKLRSQILGLKHEFQAISYEDQAAALIILEWLNFCFIQPDTPITRRLIVDSTSDTRKIKSTTARTGLEQLAALGFLKRQDDSGVATYYVRPLIEALATMREVIALQYRMEFYAKAVKQINEYGEIIELPMIPHEITPEWVGLVYPDFTPAQQKHAADYLNSDGLLELSEKERAAAEKQIVEAISKLEPLFTLEHLITLPSTKLDESDTWENGSAYRASFYKARIRWRHANKRTVCQATAAAEIGLSRKALYTLRQKHGIMLEEQFLEMPIHSAYEVTEIMPRWARNRDYGNALVSSGGKELLVNRYVDKDDLQRWCASEITTGNQVTLKLQTGSLERYATSEELARTQAKLEAQKIAAAEYRDKWEANRREKPLSGGKNDRLINLCLGLNNEWVGQQIALHPDHAFTLEAIGLGAIFTLQPIKKMPAPPRIPDHSTPPYQYEQPYQELDNGKQR